MPLEDFTRSWEYFIEDAAGSEAEPLTFDVLEACDAGQVSVIAVERYEEDSGDEYAERYKVDVRLACTEQWAQFYVMGWFVRKHRAEPVNTVSMGPG